MSPVAISVRRKKQWKQTAVVYEVTINDGAGAIYAAEFHSDRRFVFSMRRPGSTRGISIHCAKFKTLAAVALAAVST